MKCLNFVSVFRQILVDDVVFRGKADLEIAELEIYSWKCQRHYLNKFGGRIYFSPHRGEREGEWFLNCPIPLKNCSDLPEGRVRKHRWVLTSHPQGSCARANRCSWAGEWCHIPQGPSSMAWHGLCTLGWFLCEPGAAFVSAQVGASHAKEVARVFGTGSSARCCFCISRNKELCCCLLCPKAINELLLHFRILC